jgi:hypothetical protein
MAWWLAVALALGLLWQYGRQAMAWALMKLYEWLVQAVPVKV